VSFPTTYSLVTVTSGNAIVTAVKAAQDGSGQLVLRLYQPSKATVDVILAGAADGATLQPMTALEQPLDAPAVTITGGTATVTMTRTLATFALMPAAS
jgi:alpha-mannosidase